MTDYQQPKLDKGSMTQDDMDAFNGAESDAESRGGDHRPIQDNGTQRYNFNVSGMGANKDFPKIVDNFASYAPMGPDFSKDTINEYGFKPGNQEVGYDDNQLCYGVEGSPAGGKGEQGEQTEGSYKNRQQ